MATSSNEKGIPDDGDTLHDREAMPTSGRGDALTDTPPSSGDTTLQNSESSTLLSTPAPATALDRYLVDRLRTVEERLDAMTARVRLLEKGHKNGGLPSQALWLLVLPLIALMYWLSRLP